MNVNIVDPVFIFDLLLELPFLYLFAQFYPNPTLHTLKEMALVVGVFQFTLLQFH